MYKVAVIIPHYVNKQDTLDCLKSVLTSDSRQISLKIIIVLNSDFDEFTAYLKKNYPQVSTVENKKNLGFAAAVNAGIRRSRIEKSDFYIILNNDTVVSVKLIVKSVRYLSDHDEVGIISPKIYFQKGQEYHKNRYKRADLGKVIWYAGGKIDWKNIYASHRGVDQVDRGQYDNKVETDFATGCCMIMRKDVADKIGLFNEKYFMYFEDVEYSVLARKKGFKIKYFPDAYLWHKNAASSGKPGSDIHIYYQTRNRLFFGFRFGNFRAKKSLVLDCLRIFFRSRVYGQAVMDYFTGKMGKREI